MYVMVGNVCGDGNGNTIGQQAVIGLHLLREVPHLFSLPSYGKCLSLVYSFIFVGLGYHDDLQTRTVFMEVLTRILQQVCDNSFILLILWLMIFILLYIYPLFIYGAIFYDLVTRSRLGNGLDFKILIN